MPRVELATHPLVFALAVHAAARKAYAQNATVCATDQLDWYTSVVGESPCRTYERIRQICDPRYAVGEFKANVPGDTCNSQLDSCCCNSIAWNLSMLCMNCQHAGSVATDGIGFDAATGSYGLYLAGCGVPKNASLPADIQAAVCTEQIDIRETLYNGPFWVDGSWYYTYFRESMQASFIGETGENTATCTSYSISGTTTPIATPTTKHSSMSTSTFTSTFGSTFASTISSGIFTTSPTQSFSISVSVANSSAQPTSIYTYSPGTYIVTSISSTGTSLFILPSSSSSSSIGMPHNTLNVYAVAGGAAGGAIVLLLALLAGICWCHRRRARRKLGVGAMVPAARRTRTLALEPFLAGITGVGNAGVFAPPPYAETPRKGATPPTGWVASRERANVSHARSSAGAGARGDAGVRSGVQTDSDAVRPTERKRGARRVRA